MKIPTVRIPNCEDSSFNDALNSSFDDAVIDGNHAIEMGDEKKQQGWKRLRLQVHVISKFRSMVCVQSKDTVNEAEFHKKVWECIKRQSSGANIFNNISKNPSIVDTNDTQLYKELWNHLRLQSPGSNIFNDINEELMKKAEETDDIQLYKEAWNQLLAHSSGAKIFSDINKALSKIGVCDELGNLQNGLVTSKQVDK